MTDYAAAILRRLKNVLAASLGQPDILSSGYYTLLLLHAVLYALRLLRPYNSAPEPTPILLRDVGAALVSIAAANITGHALQIPSLRFLAFSYYIWQEADAVFSLLKGMHHKPPPEITSLITRHAGHKNK